MNLKKIILSRMFPIFVLSIFTFSFLLFFSSSTKADVYQPVYTKQKFISSKKQIAEGYADGVKTKFPTGGGFGWTNWEGPSQRAIGVPGYSPLISLGTIDSEKQDIETRLIEVPDHTNYYRVYVKKHYVVSKYAQFGKTIFSDKEFFVRYVYRVNVTKVEVFPKKS